MSCGDCYCYVALSHAVVGWSAVYCGISGLYLFTFSMAYQHVMLMKVKNKQKITFFS